MKNLNAKFISLRAASGMLFGLLLFAGSLVWHAPSAYMVAPADGYFSNIRLYDYDNTGIIETIEFDLTNPNFAGEPITLNGAMPHGLSATEAGFGALSITGVAIKAPGVGLVTTIQVTLSEAGRSVNTDGVNNGVIELIYTPFAAPWPNCLAPGSSCIHDGVDEEMQAMVTGDAVVPGPPATDSTEIDNANPILVSAVLSSAGNRNRITFTYSENMTLTGGNGASSVFLGNLMAVGSLAGLGSFATPGDVTVPDTLNTVGGNGTTSIFVDLADQPGGYIATGSSAPTGNFTPVASAALTDGVNLQVNTAGPVVLSAGGGWDLTKPTIVSVDVDDAVGPDGQIDQAVITLNEAMRDANVSNADANLGSGGTSTGTFTSGGVDDAVTTFNRTVDDNGFNTSAAAGDFTYSGATTYITDLAGNLLNTAVDGTIATADIAEGDNAEPVVLSARYLDNNPTNGTVDRVEFTTSTDTGITCGAGFTGGTSFTVVTAGAVGLTAGVGDTCTSNGTSTFTINLATVGNPQVTGGAPSSVASYNWVVNAVQDGNGNETPSALNLTVRDGAAPYVLFRITKDTDQADGSDGVADGQLNGVFLVFTEDLDASSVVPADFTITTNAGGALTEAYSDTTDDSTLFFRVTDAPAGNTADLLKSQIIGSVLDLATPVANAVALDGSGVAATDGAAPVALSAKYRDNTGNGVVDTIEITFSQDSLACTYEAADWSVPVPGDVGAVLAGACAVVGNAVNISVTGNPNTTGGVTNPTIQYSNVGTLNQIKDSANNGTGSFGPLAATDGAGPFMTAGQYRDSNADGKPDQVALTYTENATFTMAGGDWNFSTPSNMNFGGDFLAGDCAGSGTTTITCTDADNSGFTADANETGVSVGGQPAWTYTTSANVTDGANQAPTQTITLADDANPVVTGATLDYNDNNKSVALVVSFSEQVDASAAVQSAFHLNNVTGGVDDVTVSTATSSPDGASLTFPLTETERAAALLISGVTGGDAGAVVLDVDAGGVTDLSAAANTSLTDDNNTVVETADTNPPALTSWDLSYVANTLTLNFSETVDAATLTPTAITIQDAATATTSYTLTGGTTVSPDGTGIVIDLLLVDVEALKSNTNLAETTANAFLRTTTALIDDIATNANAAIADGAALQASSVTGTAGYGDLAGYLLLSPNTINAGSTGGVHFNAASGLPADGKIEITFPATFNVSPVSQLLNPVGIDGDFLVVPTGQVLLITRNGGGATPVPPGTDVSFDLKTIGNPSSLGMTGTFAFETRTALDAILDQDSSVAGQMIIMPTVPVNTTPTGGGGGGGGGGSGGGYRAPGVYLMSPVYPSEEEEATEEESEEGAPSERYAGPAAFGDTEGHWAEPYINQLANMGIVSGKTEDEFAPNDNISRAELLKIALGAFDLSIPESVVEKPLPDVEIGDWYAPYVQAAFDNDLIYGFENGFEPNTPASRGMSATVLTKAADFDDVEDHFQNQYRSHAGWTFAHFPDVLMDAYYAPFVAYLYDKGVIGGYEDGTFGPGNPITRAEIAKMVIKLLETYTPAESEEMTEPTEESAEPAEESSESPEESADADMMEGQGL